MLNFRHNPQSSPWAALTSLVILSALSLPVGAAPILVSPERQDNGRARIEAKCPTFSWTSVSEADGYELRVLEEHSGPSAAPVLIKQLPAGTNSWTPALGSCLKRGLGYRWSVRAIGHAVEEWPEPVSFEIDAGFSPDELDTIIAVLEERSGERAKGTTDFSVNGNGDVVASSFAGDGAGLSGVTAADVNCTGCVSSSEIEDAGIAATDINTHLMFPSGFRMDALAGIMDIRGPQVTFSTAVSGGPGTYLSVGGGGRIEMQATSNFNIYGIQSSLIDVFGGGNLEVSSSGGTLTLTGANGVLVNGIVDCGACVTTGALCSNAGVVQICP